MSARPTSDKRLAQARIIVITVGFVVVGAASGDIFDRAEWTLTIAPVPAAAAALVLVGRPAVARLAGAGIGVLLAVILTVAIADGSASDVVQSFTSGIQGLLSTDWPSPRRADLLGAVAAALATLCAISSEIVGRRRFHLLGLVPLLLAYLGVVALSAPDGITWRWLIVLAAVSMVLALLRNEGSLADRLVLLRGERRLIPLTIVAAGVVVLVALPVSFDARADPRRNNPARQTAPLLDPIEATLALRDLDPPVDLHVATATGDSALPVRWRTAALTDYDGQRWSPGLTLRPIGSTLAPAIEPTIDADVSFLDDNLSLVPFPGPPVFVGAAVETDAERTVVRLAERPTPGAVVPVAANAPATPSDAADLGVSPRVVDESTSGLTRFAEGLAGEGDALDQLSRLEASLQDDFVLDNDVQGGGLELALIDRFLRDTERGTNEQFATSFVLLARSLGIEARVATGFVVGGDATAGDAGERVVLSSADADVWPEVQLGDGSWLAYDPAPAVEAVDGAPPPPEPEVQTPAAPQPPIAPPPESASEATDDDPVTDEASGGALSTAFTWVIRGSVALAVIVLPLLAAAGVIVGAKYRRRRRRLRTPDPAARIRGAWASATDALVDAGLDIPPSATDSEIARTGTPVAPDAASQLRRLSTLSSAATFGTPRHPDILAEDAVSCLGSVEQSVVSTRTRWHRLRWHLSLRSLRPATRSPVTG
jgi:transglutaminase-like putative cysteine protease